MASTCLADREYVNIVVSTFLKHHLASAETKCLLTSSAAETTVVRRLSAYNNSNADSVQTWDRFASNRSNFLSYRLAALILPLSGKKNYEITSVFCGMSSIRRI